MSIFERLENHYKSKSYLTYHAANEHEQLLLFYPNYKSTKIYVIHKSDDSKWFDLGCLERGDDEKLGVSFYDGCDNTAEDYRFTIFYDPDSNTYWVDNSLQLFFENQEAVIATYLKENGYQLISMTGEKIIHGTRSKRKRTNI